MNAALEESQISEQDFCRRQLIEEDKLVLTDSGYHLTERGRKIVLAELKKYELRQRWQ